MGAELKCAVQRNMPEQIRNVYLGCLTAFRGLASLVMCVRAVKHPNRYSFRFVEAVLHSRCNAAGRAGFQAHLAFEENISLKEACVKLGYLSEERFDEVFRPEEMAR